jgi:hypothetical protein
MPGNWERQYFSWWAFVEYVSGSIAGILHRDDRVTCHFTNEYLKAFSGKWRGFIAIGVAIKVLFDI